MHENLFQEVLLKHLDANSAKLDAKLDASIAKLDSSIATQVRLDVTTEGILDHLKTLNGSVARHQKDIVDIQVLLAKRESICPHVEALRKEIEPKFVNMDRARWYHKGSHSMAAAIGSVMTVLLAALAHLSGVIKLFRP
jgi:hypothetical protein